MIDFLKRLLSPGGADHVPNGAARPRGREGEGRREWEARRRERGGRSPRALPAPARAPIPPDRPVEETCVTCGDPLLIEWGGVCPRCRPKLASPKTLYGARADLVGASSLTLGWLVVLQSPDESRRGALLELGNAVTILTRIGGPDSGMVGFGTYSFDDNFVSSGHAIVQRPATGDRNAAFTIEDRRHPSPSANGTFLNARKLQPGEVAPLSDGDLVRIGTTEMHFKSLWLPPGGLTS